MKKRDKKIVGQLKTKLDDFEVEYPLPLALSKENITEALKQQPAPAKKRAKILEMRRLVSAAAAVVIVFGAVTSYNLFGGSQGLKLAFDNLKGNTLTGSAELETARDEKQIVDIFKQLNQAAYKTTYDFSFRNVLGSKDSEAAADGAPTAQGDAAISEKNSAYGETNVQVKGVDEPDVMKNDGKYLYTVNGTEVNIYSLLPADNMKLVSTIKFGESKGKSEYANSLFVKDNLLVVFSNENIYTVYEQPATEQPEETKPEETEPAEPDTQVMPTEDPVLPPDETVSENSGTGSEGSSGTDSAEPATAQDTPAVDSEEPSYYRDYYYNETESVCTIYDISNRAAPKEVRRISQDGSFISARLIGSELYTLSSYYVDIYASQNLENICIPAVGVDGKSETIPAADISITKNPEPSYLIVCGVNLDDLKAEPNTKAVLGGGSEAYCTADSLFASRTVYAGGAQTRDWGGDVAVMATDYSYNTEIYRFAIGGGKVEFTSSGKVAGQVLNQFSMDEYEGYFRIATTQGDWDNSSSNVFVLNEKLQVVGKIENIAPKERIFAARFMGEAAYLVTFEQTDPLFVLDLSNPRAPKITGELKIPGFSSYLHPVGEKLLLGIGQNGNADGTTPGIKLSLFDVSDPAKPLEIDKLIIEGNTYTEAMNNHKAFMVYPEKELFGLPVVSYNYQVVTKVKPQEGSSDGTTSIDVGMDYMTSTFNTYTVKDKKIIPVRNYKESYTQDATSSYYYSGIARGTYINDTLYTFSNVALSSFSMDSGKLLDTLKITQPVYDYNNYYYGGKEPVMMD